MVGGRVVGGVAWWVVQLITLSLLSRVEVELDWDKKKIGFGTALGNLVNLHLTSTR